MTSNWPSNWVDFLKQHIGIVRGYFWALGGSAGRLVISLAYFVTIANTLSIAEFGLFATASATGIVLSRIAAFGFTSPLYRIATVKPRMIGTYTAGILAALALSIPAIVLAAIVMYLLVFRGDMALLPFAVIIIAEVFFWRTVEIVMIVCNGMGRFGHAAILVILGSALRASSAILFSLGGVTTLAVWAWYYLAANGLVMLIAIVFFYPKQRLRWQPALYLRRWRDSLAVASAEILFYLQSELDKLLVLSLTDPTIAGLYAIIMRLVDLTALPIRSFNMMLVQAVMRSREALGSLRLRAGIELVVAAISTAALVFFVVFLHYFPNALGSNVAVAAPLLVLVIAVPALRNLIEYQSELLYATGHTFLRTSNMAVIGIVKGGLLALILTLYKDVAHWAPLLNAVFAVLYVVSFALTYPALRKNTARAI